MDGTVPTEEIKRMIAESYDLVHLMDYSQASRHI